MFRDSISVRSLPILLVAIGGFCFAGAARAQTANVSLNVRYNTPGVPTSGGIYQLVARSTNFGLYGLDVYATGINPPSASSLPRGIVNGVDEAGFNIFQTYTPAPGIVGITVQQFPVSPGVGDEEGIFYGVGTTPNGDPGDVGPDFSSLTDLENSPWAVGGLALGDPLWSAAVLVAEGTLLPGVAPGFMAIAGYRGSALVFTSLPLDNESVGNYANYNLLPANTIVREIVGMPGDFNNDGKVDGLDYTVWRNNLNDLTEADINNNGDGLNGVDPVDFDVWKLNYGEMLGPGGGGLAGGQTAPEPASAILLAGAAGVLFLRRKPRFLRYVRVS